MIQFLKKLPAYAKERLLLFLPEPVSRPILRSVLWIRKVWDQPQLRKDRKALSDFLNQHSIKAPLIVFAPSLDWNTQLFQRPQQLALALARQGALVFYIQPKPDRKQPPFKPVLERMYLCNVFAKAFDVLDRPFVYILTWNYTYLRLYKSPRIIYDFVDDIDVFYGDSEAIAQYHQRLIREADLLLVTAKKLYQDVHPLRQDAILCPNGVDYEHFAEIDQANVSAPPPDLQPILEAGKPIIGYYGALARWFDYDLMRELASLRPEYSFVLIGPDYDGTFQPGGLLDFSNIYWLGVKSYSDLPNYLRYFDVATIPFKVNEITHATSPLKLFEYMAGGKPIVVTPMEESLRYEGVLVGKDSNEFAQKLDEALQLRFDPDYLSLLDRVAKSNTWAARANLILQNLDLSKVNLIESRQKI